MLLQWFSVERRHAAIEIFGRPHSVAGRSAGGARPNPAQPRRRDALPGRNEHGAQSLKPQHLHQTACRITTDPSVARLHLVRSSRASGRRSHGSRAHHWCGPERAGRHQQRHRAWWWRSNGDQPHWCERGRRISRAERIAPKRGIGPERVEAEHDASQRCAEAKLSDAAQRCTRTSLASPSRATTWRAANRSTIRRVGARGRAGPYRRKAVRAGSGTKRLGRLSVSLRRCGPMPAPSR